MKKCLFIAPMFYNYREDLKKEIENNGFIVDYFYDQPFMRKGDYLIKKIFKSYYPRKVKKYCNKILSEAGINYDLVFVILAYDFDSSFFCSLKKKYPNANFVYYLWDSVANFPQVVKNFIYFDRVLSFDLNDCQEYGIEFLPLFFPRIKNTEKNIKYDFSAIMNFYPNKAAGFDEIVSLIPKNKIGYLHLVLKSRFFYFYFKIFYKSQFRKYNSNDFKYYSLSREEAYEIYNKSTCVIDAPLSKQNGLTIRTFETLALHTKLITTNVNIKKYPFYNKQNIFVVGDGEIPDDFFDSPFVNIDSQLKKYSIESFVLAIIKEND